MPEGGGGRRTRQKRTSRAGPLAAAFSLGPNPFPLSFGHGHAYTLCARAPASTGANNVGIRCLMRRTRLFSPCPPTFLRSPIPELWIAVPPRSGVPAVPRLSFFQNPSVALRLKSRGAAPWILGSARRALWMRGRAAASSYQEYRSKRKNGKPDDEATVRAPSTHLPQAGQRR